MPAKFHPVTPAVWDRTMRELSTDAKVVRLYLLTCSSRVSEGLFHIPLGIVAHDTGLTPQAVAAAMAELDSSDLASYDADAEVVLDRTALRYSPLRNGEDKDGNVKADKRIPGAVRFFENVPDTALKAELYRLAAQHSPDLMLALGQRFSSLTFATESTHHHDLSARASEAPSPSPQAPSPIAEAPRRAEPRREERLGGLDPLSDTPFLPPNEVGIACGFCGESALLDSDGEPHQLKGRPFCGWCVVTPV
jgi:hypothetical protein